MAAINDHIQVVLTIESTGLARQSFGIPLLLSHNAWFAPRIRFYSSLTAVADDFASDSPEYRAARAMFSQTPKPRRIAIGRLEGQVTQRYDIDILDVLDEHAYQIRVAGEGFVTTTVEFVTDEDATGDEIVAGLADELNDVEDKNYTATVVVDASGADTLRIIGDDPGNWFSVEILDLTALSIAQTHAAPTGTLLGDDLSAILFADAGWYCAIPLYPSEAYLLALAEWVQANGRICWFDTVDSEPLTEALSGGNDIGAQLFELGYSRTIGNYHHAPDQFLAAAIAWRFLSKDPGKVTAKWKTLEGISASTLSDTHKVNLRARRMNAYEQVLADRAFFWEGTVFSTVYKFIDITRNADWLEDGANTVLAGVFVGNDIVPFTDEGRTMLEGALRGFIRGEAVAQGVLAPTPTVTAIPVDEVNSTDKENRNYPGLSFDGVFAGAIHTAIPVSGFLGF